MLITCLSRAVGGARGSKVQKNCGDPATCKAARVCAHLTELSSSYWENSWCMCSQNIKVQALGNVDRLIQILLQAGPLTTILMMTSLKTPLQVVDF